MLLMTYLRDFPDPPEQHSSLQATGAGKIGDKTELAL